MLHTILNPKLIDSLSFIDRYHTSRTEKTVLILIGDCIVDYRGRAQSILDWGERIVMIKQDGNILVHRPLLREPVNWQPAGTITEFKNENKQLTIRSWHSKPAEKMKIVFRSIQIIIATTLNDTANLVIAGMETDVVNQIIRQPEIIEEGLRVSKKEKHVKSGMIDLFCYDKNHIPTIIEVKRSMANISAVHQLRMYVRDIKKDIKQANVRGILCAPHIPDMVKNLLSDYDLEWREVERKVMIPDDWQKTLHDF
ncbi:MAG: endonuclease NucS [Thermoplasmatota archaeon]